MQLFSGGFKLKKLSILSQKSSMVTKSWNVLHPGYCNTEILNWEIILGSKPTSASVYNNIVEHFIIEIQKLQHWVYTPWINAMRCRNYSFSTIFSCFPLFSPSFPCFLMFSPVFSRFLDSVYRQTGKKGKPAKKQ